MIDTLVALSFDEYQHVKGERFILLRPALSLTLGEELRLFEAAQGDKILGLMKLSRESDPIDRFPAFELGVFKDENDLIMALESIEKYLKSDMQARIMRISHAWVEFKFVEP